MVRVGLLGAGIALGLGGYACITLADGREALEDAGIALSVVGSVCLWASVHWTVGVTAAGVIAWSVLKQRSAK